jgi:hypothetical protein
VRRGGRGQRGQRTDARKSRGRPIGHRASYARLARGLQA